MRKCQGCGIHLHPVVAQTTYDAIARLIQREGKRPAKVPARWREGPLCNKCQAAWSARIVDRMM
jgi:hypothetical protein